MTAMKLLVTDATPYSQVSELGALCSKWVPIVGFVGTGVRVSESLGIAAPSGGGKTRS